MLTFYNPLWNLGPQSHYSKHCCCDFYDRFVLDGVDLLTPCKLRFEFRVVFYEWSLTKA